MKSVLFKVIKNNNGELIYNSLVSSKWKIYDDLSIDIEKLFYGREDNSNCIIIDGDELIIEQFENNILVKNIKENDIKLIESIIKIIDK